MEKGELGNLHAARIDRAGAVCSGACAVHCATFSLLPSAAASFGVGVVAGAPLEWGLTAVAVALAALSHPGMHPTTPGHGGSPHLR